MNPDQNTRVPVTPGAMETLRLPTDVNLSPDGLDGREHRKDCEERILRWLERYL